MQNYKNHTKMYPLHMFVFLPITFVLFIFTLYKSFSSWSSNSEIGMMWLILALLVFFVILLSGMVRMHYGMILQNRLILHEIRFRYFKMTGKELEKDFQLTDAQLFAVRFAGDNEFLSLLTQAQKENLSPDEIKQKVTDWKADYRRI